MAQKFLYRQKLFWVLKPERLCARLSSRNHIGPLELSRIGWLDVPHRVAQLKPNLVHTIAYNHCPTYLQENFQITVIGITQGIVIKISKPQVAIVKLEVPSSTLA